MRTKAFTLTEILITIAIIGIVAALTIPGLINNYKEKSIITALRKIYSELTQATQLATLEHVISQIGR